MGEPLTNAICVASSELRDLDLDYLENRGGIPCARKLRRHNEGGGEEEEGGEGGGGEVAGSEDGVVVVPIPSSSFASEELSPVDTTDLVKVILLGAPAVGKTSIIQQFVWNEFCEQYYPTDRRHTYYPSVVINGRLYGLKISDLPPVPYFPVDSLYEWTDFRSYGLRTATAYVLVFDLSNPAETFRHIKCLREQMAGSRDMKNVPVVVVGNKHDRLQGPLRGSSTNNSRPPESLFGVPYLAQSSVLDVPGTSSSLPSERTSLHRSSSPQRHLGHANSMVFHQKKQTYCNENARAISESRERRDIANIVRKHWRCGYVECSAKYNWRVISVFKELMQAVDALEGCDTPGTDTTPGGGCGNYGGTGEKVPLVPDCGLRDEALDARDSFRLNRHPRTPMVVENLQESFDRNRCQVV